jgi:phosphoribosylaminoimidazole carboxylase (NCAIR synthetase)
MKYTQTANLIGVVGKKGAGQLDNGQTWETDRVELHCAVPFPESDTMAHGDTVMTFNVQDFAAHYEKAKSLIGQPITMDMEFVPAKKLGQAPKSVCIGFYAALPASKPKAAPVLNSNPN